ncbi:MAG: argininosuccinate lyase [Nitrososphaerota archaeon]|nr:argininosuccinate lyase [Nitrososphaerota archaeon]
MSLLRGKRLGRMDSEAAAFTASVDRDRPLLEAVIAINAAHLVSLAKNGVVDPKDAASILSSLRSAPTDLEFDTSLEDVHMNVEQYVSKKAGEAGGFLNLGKSRNDQVCTALRIVTRSELLKVVDAILELVESLIDVAAENTEVRMPGYTHLQVAQPTTVAHHLLNYAGALLRDVQRLADCYKRVNLSPMGSAAFSGTTVPVDRDGVARLLGFDGIIENSMDAVSSRDFILEFLSGALLTQLDLSRMAEDLIFYSSQEASYVDQPDDLSSTSSIMPQKKNAVVLEIIRAKAGTILGLFTSAATIVKGLPQSYNLDLQEMNSYVWMASSDLIKSLKLMSKVVRKTKYRKDRLERGAASGFSVAAELAEYLTLKHNIPFRKAHHIVGAVASNLPSIYTFEDIKKMLVKEAKNQGVRLDLSKLPSSYDPSTSVRSKKSLGSPNPLHVKLMMNHMRKEMKDAAGWARQRALSIDRASSVLAKESNNIIKEVRK